MSADAVAGFVALAGGAVVLSTHRALSPTVPAVAAPIAVAWPRGAPAVGAGVALGALLLGTPRRVPGPAFLLAIAFAVTIAVAGDGGLVRGGAAAVAIAVATPAYVRTLEDIALAAVAFGLASAGVALGAAVAGVDGIRAELISVSAAAGLAAAAGAGARAVAACDLAGVLVLPSRAGVVAAAAALLGLLLLRRLALVDAMLAGAAIAIAAIAGAPFVDDPWRSVSAFGDAYNRLGHVGVSLFVLLLAATLWGLPRPFAPGVVAAGVGAIFVPVEATASLWLLAGFAAAGDSPDGPLRPARDEQRLQAARDALRDERQALKRRRKALDEREAALARRERGLPSRPPGEPPGKPQEALLQPEFRHWDLRVLRSLVEARAAEFPDRIEEWRLYLALLEPFAENGIVGPEFDATVVEVFGPLVA